MAKRRKRTVEEIVREIEEYDSDCEFDETTQENELADLNGTADDFQYDDVGEPSIDSASDPKPLRKRLTAYRLVNSIDSALNIDNYDPLELQSDIRNFNAILRDPETKKEENLTFTNKRPDSGGRQRRCDVISESCGTRGVARDKYTERDCWELFINAEIIDEIVACTNKKIEQIIDQCGRDTITSDRASYIKNVTNDEVYAFLGLIYYRGLYNLTNISTKHLFSDEKGLPLFGAVMSYHRFVFLMSNLCFDDIDNRSERWKSDRFAAFRTVFELFNENCTKYLVPGAYLSLDETLYPMRHQIAFRQYNPDKPAKYGLLFKSLNAAGFPYCHRTTVYAGKPEGEPSEFYLKGTANYVKDLVSKTNSVVSLQGRSISMDRLYSSIPLARWLLSQNITMLGTIQQNRSGIPKEVKDTSNREELSTEIYWTDNGNINLSSYVVKTKSSGMKNVLLLSTNHPLMGVTKDDEKKKAGLYKLYDFTKGGTDECDKRAESYMCKPKSRKWTIVALAYVLDMARINAQTIRAFNNNEDPRQARLSSFDFGINLVKALTVPFIQARPLNGLSQKTQIKMRLFTDQCSESGSVSDAHTSTTEKQRRRCIECMKRASGEGYKKKREKLPKMITVCEKCKRNFCKSHLFSVCDSCKRCI